jgi:hypothetical protein
MIHISHSRELHLDATIHFIQCSAKKPAREEREEARTGQGERQIVTHCVNFIWTVI